MNNSPNHHTMMNDKFHNPYESVPDQEQRVLTIRVNESDYNLIKCMRPSTGTVSGTAGTLWQKLCERLRDLSITDVSKQKQFEEFVAEMVILSKDEYLALKNNVKRKARNEQPIA
jgi:hypothetical protein